MEAGECRLTRGTCFIARRLELVAVAGLLWISWCVLGAADFFVFFFFPFERTRPAASMKSPCLMYLSTKKVRFRSANTDKQKTPKKQLSVFYLNSLLGPFVTKKTLAQKTLPLSQRGWETTIFRGLSRPVSAFT